MNNILIKDFYLKGIDRSITYYRSLKDQVSNSYKKILGNITKYLFVHSHNKLYEYYSVNIQYSVNIFHYIGKV